MQDYSWTDLDVEPPPIGCGEAVEVEGTDCDWCVNMRGINE